MWKIDATCEFETWLRSLDAKSQAHIVKSADKLAIFGPALGRPDVDSIKNSRHPNMKELRIKHAGHQYRVFFAFDPRRTAILLIGGDKAGTPGGNEKRFYKQHIAHADRLFDQYLNELKMKDDDHG